VSPDNIPGTKPTHDQQITANEAQTRVPISWASVKPLLYGCPMEFAFELQSTTNAVPVFQFTGQAKAEYGRPQ
jgi:hypothetical protein